MQHESGLKKALSSGWVYSWFQTAVGAKRARRWLAANVWKCEPGDKVVDIGCGPGDMLEQLPDTVRYVGIDISEKYVERARQRFGERATFVVGTARTFLERGTAALDGADLVVCNGLLHHLNDDEVLEVLQLGARVLKPHGRFVCVEPTYLQHQPIAARWVMDKDRGRNIRTDVAWTDLARTVFPDSSARILTGLLRLPYTHVVIEMRQSGAERRATGSREFAVGLETGRDWMDDRDAAPAAGSVAIVDGRPTPNE